MSVNEDIQRNMSKADRKMKSTVHE